MARLGILVASLCAVAPVARAQQQSATDVLLFLLTNRSVNTGDTGLDQTAAAATAATLSRALQVDLATMPVESSASGFNYGFNPALGTLERRTSTFGPFFVERALSSGRNRFSIGLALQVARFDALDGNALRSGRFVTLSNTFNGETTAFDADALALSIQANTMTFSARYGLTSRLDVSGSVPLVSLRFNGQRTNTYRDQTVLQAVASMSTIGLGDVGIHAKYHLTGDRASGFAVAADVRLPTGRAEDLLGAGRTSVGGLAIASLEQGRLAVHANGGFSVGGISKQLLFGVAGAVAATPRVTIAAELLGRRFLDINQIAVVSFPNPAIRGVTTQRLLSAGAAMMPILATAGVKWNVAEQWVLDVHVLVPVSQSGLTTRFTPVVALERAF